MTKKYGFACSCSPESRAKAEGWAREAFPKLETGKEKLRLEEPQPASLVELGMLSLARLGQDLRMYFQVGIVTDQWCALDVVGKPWNTIDDEETWESYGCQFDWDCLGHALSAVILQIEDKHPEVKEKKDAQ